MLSVIQAHDAHSITHGRGYTLTRQPYRGITRGYGEFMARYGHDHAEWVAYQPHDVTVDYEQLCQAITECPGEHFQLALSHDSYYSHHWTLQQGSGWREVPFVEAMLPVFRWDFYCMVRPYLSQSKSGWGLDLLWSSFGVPYLCDTWTMTHHQPVTSMHMEIDGVPAPEEMRRIQVRYRL